MTKKKQYNYGFKLTFPIIDIIPPTIIYNPMTNTRTKSLAKSLIRQLRLNLFIMLLGILIKLIPNDCINTFKWLKEIPYEN